MKIGHAEKQKGKRRGVIGGSCSRGSRAALAATAKLFQQQPEASSDSKAVSAAARGSIKEAAAALESSPAPRYAL